MFAAGDVHGTLISLMHRAGRGESVAPDLDELIARLEQTKASETLPDWRKNIVNIRGSFLTHFVGPTFASAVRKDLGEVRRASFAEAAIDRLGNLMGQAA